MSQSGSLKLSINLNRGVSSTTENSKQIDQEAEEPDIYGSRPTSNESATSSASNTRSGRTSRNSGGNGEDPEAEVEAEPEPDADLLQVKVPTASKNARKRKHIQTVFDETKLLNQTALDAQRKEKERLERLEKLKKAVPDDDHIAQMAALLPTRPVQPEVDNEPLPVLDAADIDMFNSFDPDRWPDLDFMGMQHPSTSGNTVHQQRPIQHEIIDLSSDDEDEIKEVGAYVPRRIEPKFPVLTPRRNRWVNADKERAGFEQMEEQLRVERDRLSKRGQMGDIEKVELKEGLLIVNRGHPDEDPDITVAPHLTYTLQPHQLGGIRFMYDNVIESINEYRSSPGFGCILAHSMGLGKTIQVVTFTEIFFRATQAHKILIIVPINTIQNWLNEYEKWIPKFTSTGERLRPFDVFILGDAVKTFDQRVTLIEQWATKGGVLLIGYDMFRLLIRGTQPKKPTRPKLNFVSGQKIQREEKVDDFETGFTSAGRIKKEANSIIREALLDPGPDLVVCDEGHKIKNLNTDISMALGAIRTTRRIVLTGYPLQNNLMEYYCMVDFVRPKYLGEKKSFSIMFEKPIKNGQCVDSTPSDVKLALQRTHVLIEMLKGFVQRRTHHLLKTILPESKEYVLLLRKSPLQHVLYRNFLLYANKEIRTGNTGQVFNPLKAFAACSKIWNHPDVLANTLNSRRELKAELDAEKARRNEQQAQQQQMMMSFIPPPVSNYGMQMPMQMQMPPMGMNGMLGMGGMGMMPHQDPNMFNNMQGGLQASNHRDLWAGLFGTTSNYPSDLDIVDNDEDAAAPIKKKTGKPGRPKKANLATALFDELDMADTGLQYDWAEIAMAHHQLGNIEHGYKMKLAMEIIDETTKNGEKILLFSQNLTALDIIEKYLEKRKLLLPDNKEADWQKSKNYYRLDGSTNGSDREKLINRFNADQGLCLFLISTRAGSLGINLVSANRCIILDACWNPCHDAQAVCRVYRYGQQRKTFIYRLVMDNCMEKAVFNRQISKHGLQQRVVDDAAVDANVTQKELETLLMYDESLDCVHDEWDTTRWNIEDPLLARVVARNSKMLAEEPFLHESLILEREDGLSEEEKKEAQLLFAWERSEDMRNAAASSMDPFDRGGFNPLAGITRVHNPPWLGQDMAAMQQGMVGPPALRAAPIPHQLVSSSAYRDGGGGMTMSGANGSVYNNMGGFDPPIGLNRFGNSSNSNSGTALNTQMMNMMSHNQQNNNQFNGLPSNHQYVFTFSDGQRSLPGAGFAGASFATDKRSTSAGSMQKIVTDRDLSFPLLSDPSRLHRVPAASEVSVVRTGTGGVFIRLLNGTLLEATGSLFDVPIAPSSDVPRSLVLPPPLFGSGSPDVIELD